MRELATGQHAHTVLHLFTIALRDRGRVQEAETVMREAIAVDDWVGYRAWLSSALLQDGRLDDAITVAEPTFSWYYCSNLLAPLVYPLLDQPEELLYLLDHPLTVPHHGHEEFQHLWRAFALAGLGRAEEAITVVEAHPIRGPTPASSGPASSAPPATSLPPPLNCKTSTRSRRVKNCSRSSSSKDRRSEP
ncbi:hypothetical protein [Streptomyces sp. V1I6]|uniref:hypothetical protein n=1 Tax=Streptomyces sp. V1I6 TaxID=3042273 RepID=UPI00278AEE79|nr:hypothetical protein [Streptomyces sp. V1I6]MDQ0847602.1 hypothetical protein [Streptomyces sp. V1I6]